MPAAELIKTFLPAVIAVAPLMFSYFLVERQRHRFETQLENLRHSYDVTIAKLRTELLVDAHVRRRLAEARFDKYSHLGQLIGQAFDRALSLVFTWSNPDFEWDREFALYRNGISALGEYVHTSRLELESDGLFNEVYRYAHMLREFSLDVPLLERLGAGQESIDLECKIHRELRELEACQGRLLRKLSTVRTSSEADVSQHNAAQAPSGCHPSPP